MTGGWSRIETDAVVSDADARSLCCGVEPHPYSAGFPMPGDIGQGFLNDTDQDPVVGGGSWGRVRIQLRDDAVRTPPGPDDRVQSFR